MQPTQLSFTTGIGTGNCGTLQSTTGSVLLNLACGGLYTGGGGNSVPLPYAVPDMGQSFTKVTACSDPTLTLSGTTPTEAGVGNICTQGAASKRGTSCTADSNCATPCTVNADCFSGGGVGTCLTGACTTAKCSFEKCTNAGCLFGQPLPIPNPASTPTSVCVVNVVATNASGTADCRSGASALSLPLTSQLYLAGDLEPSAPGIQVCPVCNKTCNAGTNNTGPCNTDADCPGAGAGSCTGPNVCHGSGTNNGGPCTPADSVVGPLSDFPTSHDCPPPAVADIGGLPIAFALTTGTTSKTAQAISGQLNVFCGFCRDITAAGTGCFEGDSAPGCPANSGCIGAGNPFNCCTGVGAGSCDQTAPKPCFIGSGLPTACTDGNGSWPDCQQRNPGAFGPAGGGARTITETGAPAGTLSDGAGHASTLVSIFCIQPTFNATVDAAGDLPGPGAVSLPGTAQLLP